MSITATELNKNPGKIIDAARREPVIIEKMGRPSVVMLSYERFRELEDAYWGNAAEEAAQDPQWLSSKETEAFLKR